MHYFTARQYVKIAINWVGLIIEGFKHSWHRLFFLKKVRQWHCALLESGRDMDWLELDSMDLWLCPSQWQHQRRKGRMKWQWGKKKQCRKTRACCWLGKLLANAAILACLHQSREEQLQSPVYARQGEPQACHGYHQPFQGTSYIKEGDMQTCSNTHAL